MIARRSIGGVPIDLVSMREALVFIRDLVRQGTGGCVFTPNVDHIVIAQHDREFAAAYQGVTLSLIDGTPVLWAARALGWRCPERVAGSDLLWPLLEMAEREGLSVYLLGGAEGSTERARDRLKEKFPDLKLVGADAPWIDLGTADRDDREVIDPIVSVRPDLLIVGFGAPKQEVWIHRHRKVLGSVVCLGLGAGIDFLAGRVRRAPRWMSILGLEWFFRLLLEPRRLAARYLLRDPAFVFIVIRQMFR